MAEYESFDAAANALAEAAQVDHTPEPSSEPAEPSVTTGDTYSGDQSTTPASREIDLSSIPDEAKQFIAAREREMTADYTRKTQEAAQARQEAEQAIQFVQALNSDPNFAYQVTQYLSQQYAFDNAQQGPEYSDPAYDEYGDYVDNVPDPYMEKISELEQWKNGLEAAMYQQQAESQIHHQLAELRSQNPSWSDDDLNDVLRFGFATGGDLHQAADLYKSVNQRVVGRYVDQKSSVNTPAPVGTTSGQQAPEGFHNLNDPALRAAALTRIRNEMGE
jgi:hypothetical protein